MEDYRIVADSCCEVTPEMMEGLPVSIVPFSMTVDDTVYVDNPDLDPMVFLQAMKDSPNCPKSGCPTPYDYEQAAKGAKHVFMITISGALSGSYESACVAKKNIEAQNPDAKVHVFNSKSASSGETVIFLKLKEYLAQGLSFAEVVEKTQKYVDTMHTLFVLESLDNLIKNGRMSKFSGALAGLLSICPIMGGDREGEIKLYEKALGIKKAINKLIDVIEREAKEFGTKGRTLVVTHCNNRQRAEYIQQKVQERMDFDQVVINETRGLGTMYAFDGGVVIAF